MKEDRNIRYSIPIILFVALFLFTSLMTLLKFVLLYEGGFNLASAFTFISQMTAIMLLLFVYAIYCFLGRYRLIKRPKELAVIVTCIAISYTLCPCF